jgi:hypothetical protein
MADQASGHAARRAHQSCLERDYCSIPPPADQKKEDALSMLEAIEADLVTVRGEFGSNKDAMR